MQKTEINFFEWIIGNIEHSDAVGYLARWLTDSRKKRKISLVTSFPSGDIAKSEYDKWLRRVRAPKHIKACFETAWERYWRKEDIDERIGVHQVIGRVKRNFKSDHEPDGDETEEILAVRKFVTSPANVGVEMRVTANLGNYESATFRIGVNVPCYREEIDEAYKAGEKWCAVRVKNEFKKIKGNEDLDPEPKFGMTELDEDLIPEGG